MFWEKNFGRNIDVDLFKTEEKLNACKDKVKGPKDYLRNNGWASSYEKKILSVGIFFSTFSNENTYQQKRLYMYTMYSTI